MFSYIEAQRSKLEDIDAIESNLAKRFRRNPYILPENKRTPDDILTSSRRDKRPQKERLLQQHEAKVFDEKFKAHSSSLKLRGITEQELYKNELKRLDDPSFLNFDKALESIKQKHETELENGVQIRTAEDINKVYSPYSSAYLDSNGGSTNIQTLKSRNSNKEKVRVKRKYVVSSAASHLNMDEMFSTEELYGKCLDLLPFYDLYKQNIGTDVKSYVEYLHLFKQFPSAVPDNKTQFYGDYLTKLLKYLEEFVYKTNPLGDNETEIQALYGSYKDDPIENDRPDGVENEKGEVYCTACDKVFAKLTVYTGHLGGKKHKKNLTNPQKQGSSNSLSSTKKREFEVSQLVTLLKSTLDATISNAERKDAMTERERIIEGTELAGEESEYTTVNNTDSDMDSDSEDNSDSDYDDENTKDLPLGADGNPIPFWLYKLQGLHKSYSCEICGNISYKGRMAFAKHFTGGKHQHGLRCLGITDEYLTSFKNITNIEEALDLWKKVKRDKRIDQGEVENAIEVEDDEGNVMSEKDYLELKKQGLL